MAARYTKEHEWITVDGDVATIGITDHAQEQLGDVVFVELPAVGKKVSKGGEAAVVESVKAASEVYAPVSGEVVDVNKELEGDPALVNREAETDLRRSLDEMDRLFRQGQPGVDLLRVLDIRRKLLRARDGYLDAQLAYVQALAELALAVGDPGLAMGVYEAPEAAPKPTHP